MEITPCLQCQKNSQHVSQHFYGCSTALREEELVYFFALFVTTLSDKCTVYCHAPRGNFLETFVERQLAWNTCETGPAVTFCRKGLPRKLRARGLLMVLSISVTEDKMKGSWMVHENFPVLAKLGYCSEFSQNFSGCLWPHIFTIARMLGF